MSLICFQYWFAKLHQHISAVLYIGTQLGQWTTSKIVLHVVTPFSEILKFISELVILTYSVCLFAVLLLLSHVASVSAHIVMFRVTQHHGYIIRISNTRPYRLGD